MHKALLLLKISLVLSLMLVISEAHGSHHNEKKHGKKEKFFDVQVKLQEPWKIGYSKLNSDESKNLTKRLFKAFKTMPELRKMGFIKLIVNELTKGSVIVDFTLTLANGTENDVRTKLGERVQTGMLGDMKVDKNSLTVHEHKHEKYHSKNHLSLEAKAVIIVLAIVLSCVFIAVGVWFYMKGKKSKKQNKVQEEFDNPIKFPHDTVA